MRTTTAQEDSKARRLFDAVPRKTRRLVVAALAPAVVLAFASGGGGASSTKSPLSSGAPESPQPAAISAPEAESDPNRRTYAVALPALRGLPEDAPPGTRLDLWVAWDRGVKSKRRLQHLLDDVRLERIAPAATPDGVPAALLSVPEEAVGDLLYGDLLGDFAVTIRG